MIQKEDDYGLRKLFQELRSYEESIAPTFRAQRQNVKFTEIQLRLALAVILLISLTVALLVGDGTLTMRTPQSKTITSITDWRAPTDFLLQIPGNEILNSTPDFGLRFPEYQHYESHKNGVKQ